MMARELACPQCGAAFTKALKFCPHCGAKQNANDSQEPLAQQTAPVVSGSAVDPTLQTRTSAVPPADAVEPKTAQFFTTAGEMEPVAFKEQWAALTGFVRGIPFNVRVAAVGGLVVVAAITLVIAVGFHRSTTPGTTLYVTRNDAVVRDAPTSTGNEIGRLTRGAMVEGAWKTDETGQTNWFRLGTGSMAGGYLWTKNLTSSPPPVIVKWQQSTRTVLRAAALHADPAANSSVLQQINPAMTVFVVGEVAGGWYEILLKRGGVGYLYGDAFEAVPAAPQQQSAVAEPEASRPTAKIVFVASPENTQDIWTTSVYSYAPGGGGPGGGLDNDQLRVGGWGDWYWSLLRFDLSNYPKQAAHALLELYNEGTSAPPTPFVVFVIDQKWGWTKGDRLWWSNRPTQMHKVLYHDAPAPHLWVSIDITDIYNAWQSGQAQNFGLALLPVYNNNNFDQFRSSKYPDESYRPKLLIIPAQRANSDPAQ